MNDLLSHSVFSRIPTIMEIIISGSVLVGSYITGIIIKRILLKWVLKIAGKTKWKGDDIIFEAAKNVIVIFFILIGLYFIIQILPVIQSLRTFLLLLLRIGVILLATIIVARIVSGYISMYQVETKGKIRSTSILQYAAKGVIFIISGLFILQSLGVSITPLLTALGVGGLAVALALQDTLSNLFAGLQILASKSMEPGDFIRLENGDEGFITDINWRSTTVKALSNFLIIIPNNKLATSVVKNFDMPDKEIAVLVDMGVSYNSDLDKVEKVTMEVGQEIMKKVEGGIPEFKPFIRYNKLGPYTINFTVILRGKQFVDQYLITHEFIKMIYERYKKENIEIPLPVTNIYMNQKPD